jgi:hypothetical protein
MRSKLFIFLALVMLFAVVIPAAAQTSTATPDATAPAQSTAQPNNQNNGQGTNQQGQNQQGATNARQISRIRIAYLVPDGPVLVPFVNGQSSNIQLLQAPALTGWIEFPGPVTLSLVPQGSAQGNAGGVGPISLNGMSSQWTTIAVVGSYQAGTMRAFAFNERYSQVAGNCARVTVFNAVESNLGSTLLLNNQSVFNTALNFPGSQQGRGAAAGTSSGQNNQSGSAGQSGTTGQGSAAGQNGQNNNGAFNNSGCNNQTASTGTTTGAQAQNTAAGAGSQTGNGIGTFGCASLLATRSGLTGTGTNSQQGSTSGTTGSSNNQQGSTGSSNGTNNQQGNTAGNNNGINGSSLLGGTAMTFGQTSGNCGYTFDVPAGTYNLQFAPGGANGSGGAGVTSQFNAGSYYFVAEIGTATNPQVFVASVSGSQLTPLISGSQNGAQANGTNNNGTSNGNGSGNGTGTGNGNGNGSGSGNG